MSENGTNIPFDPALEEAVLGAVLTNCESYHTVANVLVDSADFFLLRHQWIWQAICKCASVGERFDYLLVAGELDKAGHLDDIGGSPYLLRLVNNTPDSTLAKPYAEFIHTRAVRRRLLVASEQMRLAALNDEITLEQVSAEIERHVFSALATGAEDRTMTIADAASKYYDHVIEVQKGGTAYLGIPTGFNDLDNITKGAQKGQLIYVAGRPGMGKSALLTAFALNAARSHKQRVFIWSGEMNILENVGRFIAVESEIDTQRLQTGNMNPSELSRFTEVALKRTSDWKVWIDDRAGITVETLRSQCLRYASLHGLDMVMVDYTGLLRTSLKTHGRTEEMGEISRGLKRLAMELNVPVYAAAQLNRKCEERPNKRPILSDLRDSGDLEQDANVIMFLYRDEVYNENTEFPNQAEIIVAKNRNGPTGVTSVYWDRAITKFRPGTLKTYSLKGEPSHDLD